MAQKVPVWMLEVTVESILPTLWEWRVCDREVEVAYGYETSRETAQICGDTVMFRMLSRGLI